MALSALPLSQPAVQPVSPALTGQGLFHLRLLATSDLHVHLTPWDYATDRSSQANGLARTAALIAIARAEVALGHGTCLLLDNGDFLHGSALGDLEALRDGPHAAIHPMPLHPMPIHPMIAAMNALGYDAATLGNHEFSGGLGFLMSRISAARFPIVSANIARRLGPTPLDDHTLMPATALLARDLTDRNGTSRRLKVGIIGLLPPQTTQWDRQHLGDALVTRDMLEAAAAHVPRLRADGADIVIALSHSGIGPAVASANMENASAALAALPGIDALVAGHTHQTFPSADFAASAQIDPERGLLWGKPAVMPGFHGSHLGVIDLALRWSAAGWSVASGTAELRPIARRTRSGRMVALVRSARDIMAIAAPAHRATRAWTTQPIGHSDALLHSYFALVMPCPTVRLVARAQAGHVAHLLRGGPYGDLPLISAAAPFHAGGRGGPENYTIIPPGPVSLRHAHDLYPHPNVIAALLVSGAELALWLERSFSLFNTVNPGDRDAALINPDFPPFNFDLLEGLTWQVDLTRPPRFDSHGVTVNPASHRIRNLARNGRPVAPAARFVLATNSYRAAGSGGFAGASPDRMILPDPVCGPIPRPASSRDILLDHIARSAALAAAGPPNWRFVPMGDTTVLFDSAPQAADHIADLLPMQATALDLTPGGFRRFRLHL